MRRARLALLAITVVLPIAACDDSATNDVVNVEDAEAPTPGLGQITFPTVARTAIDGLINRAECESPTATIRLKAQTNSGNPIVQYQLYAANDKAIADTSANVPCETSSNTSTGLVAGPVDALRTDHINGSFILNVEYATSTIVAAATLPGPAPCNATKDIVLCFQAKDASFNNVGVARVKITLVVDKPEAPILQSVTPGDGALTVKWNVPTPTVNESYEVATMTRDPLDPEVVGAQPVVRTSPRVSGTELRVGGLTNGAVYFVQVQAFSDADNPSDPSNAITASPASVPVVVGTVRGDASQENGLEQLTRLVGPPR
jgi:hypothetical protein